MAFLFGSVIDAVIEGLMSASEEKREAAAARLNKLSRTGLKFKDGVKAIRAATGRFPARRSDFQDSPSDLIQATWNQPDPRYVPLILEIYGLLGEKARFYALSLLGRIAERQAAQAYVETIRTYGWPQHPYPAVVGTMRQQPRHGDVLFPALVQVSLGTPGEMVAFDLLLGYSEAEAVSSETMAPCADALLLAYRKRQAKLMPKQQQSGISWRWEEDYNQSRTDAGLLLDLMGYAPRHAVSEELQAALAYRDPHLTLWAATSLLRHGCQVDPGLLREIASSRETRRQLYTFLEEHDHLQLYPREFASQAALAESDMVNWLCFPTELGREPDEIELMKVVSVQAEPEGELLDYYVFRFRTFEPHWSAEKGWTAGVSGPFHHDGGLSGHAPGGTFSNFEPWDSRTPEEHLGDIAQTVDGVQPPPREKDPG